jgi:hypothetical protein
MWGEVTAELGGDAEVGRQSRSEMEGMAGDSVDRVGWVEVSKVGIVVHGI